MPADEHERLTTVSYLMVTMRSCTLFSRRFTMRLFYACRVIYDLLLQTGQVSFG